MSKRVIDDNLLYVLRVEKGLTIEACARKMGNNRTTVGEACKRLGIGGKRKIQKVRPDTRLDNPTMETSQKFLQAKLVG